MPGKPVLYVGVLFAPSSETWFCVGWIYFTEVFNSYGCTSKKRNTDNCW